MKEILIFAGTTEGRKLSEHLAHAGIMHTVCVATEYGQIVLKEHSCMKIHQGRMDIEEISEFVKQGDFAAIVDATHPYADVVTENIKAAIQDSDIPYLRLKRQINEKAGYDNVVTFADNESCAKSLKNIEGNILLTTGSKELSVFCHDEDVKKRLYVRIIPGLESLTLCVNQGIFGKQIIALQGPFTMQMNEAMLRQYNIRCLVTKSSGRAGGYIQKIEAAKKVGIPVYVIGHYKEDEGYSFNEVCDRLESICDTKIRTINHLEITLAGIGMGSQGNLTKDVHQAIENADILIGAKRMIEKYQPIIEKKPFYEAKQIIPYLKKISNDLLSKKDLKVVVLFSGDSGFYSGCRKIYEAINEEINSGNLDAAIRVLPGISSVSYLASCIGESYQDAKIYSMHGKELLNLAQKIRREHKIYMLMSGVSDVQKLGKIMIEAGLCHCTIYAGYQLSYPDEQVFTLTPSQCADLQNEGLYTCLIINNHAQKKNLVHGIADSVFVRGEVPMTKEEVRQVSICKLKLYDDAVVYDVGSGTGSIAIEIAGLSDNVKVYAIECKDEALSLIKKNKDKFHLENIEIIKATAPKGFLQLPVPTHVFIGGSKGNMKEILTSIYDTNSKARVVINAISLETICEIKEILSLYPIEDADIVQIQVSKAKMVGKYHLMQAQNPVWICSFSFNGEENLIED